MSKSERVFIVVQVQFSNLKRSTSRIVVKMEAKKINTLMLIQSARTFASAHLLVRGGRIAVDPNMTTRVLCAS